MSRENVWRKCPGGISPGGKCPGGIVRGKCPGGNAPGEMPREKCPGGNCPGGKCPGEGPEGNIQEPTVLSMSSDSMVYDRTRIDDLMAFRTLGM
jgi:hypothetical protein